MKRFILYFVCWVIVAVAHAQQDKYAIPEFAKMPAEYRHDSISQWFMEQFGLNGTDKPEKLRLIKASIDYAGRSNDHATKTSMTFFLGYLYSMPPGSAADSIKGMEYMWKASDMAEEYDLDYAWAGIMNHLGVIYYSIDRAKALEYEVRSYEMDDRIGTRETWGGIERSYNLGTLYYHLGNYKASIQTLLPTLEMPQLKTDRFKDAKLTVANTIGLAYRAIGESDSALFYFRRILSQAGGPPRNLTWIGLASSNIGSVYLVQDQIDSALHYAQLSYDIIRTDTGMSGFAVGEALVTLAQANMKKRRFDIALPQLLEADKLIKGKQIQRSENTDRMMLKVCFSLAEAYHEKGEDAQAKLYMQKALKLQKEVSYKNNTEAYTRVQEQLEAERSISQIKEAESAIRISVQRRNFSIAGLCLAGLIFFSLYRRQQTRNEKNRALFDSREQLLFQEKKQSEESLASYVKHLWEKNNLIEHVQRELEILEKERTNKEGVETFDEFDGLRKLKHSTIITNDDWTGFKTLFEKVYEDFFPKLKRKFPDITPAEMRMMALMKLDIPTRKMADMLGISPESIRQTQYRFMKKMNLSGSPDLVKIVNTL